MDIKYVKTSDINMASTLLTLGFPIDGIHAKEGQIHVYDFYFAKSKELSKAIKDYWDKELRIEPLQLFSSRKDILTRMRDDAENYQEHDENED